MKGKIRRRHSPEFKLKAVLEILKGDKTANELAGLLGVHPMQRKFHLNPFQDSA